MFVLFSFVVVGSDVFLVLVFEFWFFLFFVFVNLTQARVIRKEGNSFKKILSFDWLQGIFLIGD